MKMNKILAAGAAAVVLAGFSGCSKKGGAPAAEEKVETPTDAIMKSVAEATNSLNAKLIITPTISGKTARLISTLEPSCCFKR